MKTLFLCAALAFAGVSATIPVSAQQATRAPDGQSIEQAIPVESISGEMDYIRRAYPGWRKTRQALIRREGRAYDRITIESPSGETKTIFFDITAFFGRM